MTSSLDAQLKYKDYQNEVKHVEKETGKEEVMRKVPNLSSSILYLKVMSYQDWVKFDRGQKNAQQQLYKDILDKQV